MIKWTDFFYYDESSPSCLRWAVTLSNRAKKDSVAGSVSGAGYWQLQVNGSRKYCHRIIWEIFNGEIPEGFEIDHLNGVKDNKISNLELKSSKGNKENRRKSSNNTSGFVGVSLWKNDWAASCFDECGKSHRKTFAILKYGFDGAKELAIKARAKMVAEFNARGTQYTERHGT